MDQFFHVVAVEVEVHGGSWTNFKKRVFYFTKDGMNPPPALQNPPALKAKYVERHAGTRSPEKTYDVGGKAEDYTTSERFEELHQIDILHTLIKLGRASRAAIDATAASNTKAIELSDSPTLETLSESPSRRKTKTPKNMKFQGIKTPKTTRGLAGE